MIQQSLLQSPLGDKIRATHADLLAHIEQAISAIEGKYPTFRRIAVKGALEDILALTGMLRLHVTSLGAYESLFEAILSASRYESIERMTQALEMAKVLQDRFRVTIEA